MNTLRSKMIRIAFLAVMIVFVLLSLIINFTISIHNMIQSDNITQLIADNNGRMPMYVVPDPEKEDEGSISDDEDESTDLPDIFPWGYNEESPYRTRYFLVILDDDENPINTDSTHIASVSRDDAFKMTETAVQTGSETGYIDEFRFRRTSNDELNYYIFLDCTENFHNRHVVLLITLAIFVGFTALIMLILAICAKYVLKPFEENSKRQKQFVTDASHELKTPLAIISANAEVLEYKNGENKWTQTITQEVAHMSELINQLMTLAKLQETDLTVVKEPFDMSGAVSDTIEKFTEVAASKKAVIETETEQDITFNGNREQIEQLISILTENAAKYVTEEGKIITELSAKGKKVTFSIFNTAKLDENTDYERIFDRFYRTDSSRSSKTGGHGIGLSIAKQIAHIYDGSIKAAPEKDGLKIICVLMNTK